MSDQVGNQNVDAARILLSVYRGNSICGSTQVSDERLQDHWWSDLESRIHNVFKFSSLFVTLVDYDSGIKHCVLWTIQLMLPFLDEKFLWAKDRPELMDLQK